MGLYYFIYGTTSVGAIILLWGLEERKIFPGYRINSTIILGLLLMIGSLIYHVYTDGIIFGFISWIIITLLACILQRFITARYLP